MKKKIWISIFAICIGAGLLTSCSAVSETNDLLFMSSSKSDSMIAPAAMEMTAEMDSEIVNSMERAAFEGGVQFTAAETPNNKVIHTASLEIETKTFDETTSAVTRLCKENGGYAEYSYVSGKGNASGRMHAEYTFRIPSENLDRFIELANEEFTVVSENLSGTDVSGIYYDTEARLVTLRIQQERLNELVKEAAGLEDIIRLNQELTNVEYQIESLSGNLKSWDGQIAYSSVSIRVRYLAELDIGTTETGFGEKIQNTWNTSISALTSIAENVSLMIIFFLPFLTIIAIVITIIIVSVKIHKKRKKKV